MARSRQRGQGAPRQHEKEVKRDDARHAIAEATAGKGRRQEFAAKLRQIYLDQGTAIEVRTGGRNAERLMLNYVLFNAVWTNAFQRNDTLFAARIMGFKSVDIDSGYDYVRLGL
jgi:hypothetical protein